MTPRPNVTFLGRRKCLRFRRNLKKPCKGETMAAEPEVQVSHFLDQYGVGSFHYKLLFWSVLIALHRRLRHRRHRLRRTQASSRSGTSRRKNSASC